VFVADGQTARFKPVKTGIVDGEAVEVTDGLDDSAAVITLGSAALRDGDPIVIAGQGGRGGRGDGRGGGQSGRDQGGAPQRGQRPGGGA
jgi:hypothetical protein